MQKKQQLTDPLRTERKRNSDFGMPEIDEETETVVSYILTRLLGAIPSFQYTTSEDALNSICAEYCYALMRHRVKDMEVINRAIDRIVDLGEKFLPPAGQLALICKDIMRNDERHKSAERQFKQNRIDEAADIVKREAIAIHKARGNVEPRLAYFLAQTPGDLKVYFAADKIWRDDIEKVIKELKLDGGRPS